MSLFVFTRYKNLAEIGYYKMKIIALERMIIFL